jgi:hypothetical protein
MHPSLLAGSAAVLLALAWLLGRRRPTLTAAIDTQAIAALNRAQIALVSCTAAAAPASNETIHVRADAPALPATPRERVVLLRRLASDMACDTPQRLAAIRSLARGWAGRASLPLLYRGLRDVDPRVVREAAQAMERYRGRSTPAQSGLALPRNVARTR